MEKEEKVYKAFFILLRAGLWDKMPELDCFPLSESAWEELYVQARKQTVEGIIYDGITRLPDEYMPSQTLLMKWTVLIDMLERRNSQMNQVIAELNRKFIKNDIRAVLLKGQGIAICYDQPLHRVCGDIDWYFPQPADYVKAIRLLFAEGILVQNQPGFSASFQWNGFIVEFHQRMLDIHNPLVSSYLQQMQKKELNGTLLGEMGGGMAELPPPVLTHLIVNSHILKHMLAFGIGIRQICDSARICYSYHVEKDNRQLEEIYRKVGMYRWMQSLNHLLVKEIGLPEECLPFPLATQKEPGWMMNEIWKGGNFGFYDYRFGSSNKLPWEKRSHVWQHLLHRFALHVRYVPSEACWFPLMQGYSRLRIMMKI